MPTLDTPLTTRVDRAVELAHRVHRRQARKGTQIPYLAHVLGVAAIVLEDGGSEDEAIAALLHDSIEDAPDDFPVASVRREIREKFGEVVLAIVEHCTDTDVQPKPAWRARKARYLAALEQAPEISLRVSAADKLHNVRALIRDYRTHGDSLWDRFNPDAGKHGTLGYYRALVEVFKRRMPGALTNDLEQELIALERLAGSPVTGSGEGVVRRRGQAGNRE
jgi:(p)ppGpp synthase/HD superfamily hydrolase